MLRARFRAVPLIRSIGSAGAALVVLTSLPVVASPQLIDAAPEKILSGPFVIPAGSFGAAAVVEADRLLVAAPRDRASGGLTGRLHVWRRTATGYQFELAMTPPNCWSDGSLDGCFFGDVVAAANGVVGVRSGGGDRFGDLSDLGKVHFYDLGSGQIEHIQTLPAPVNTVSGYTRWAFAMDMSGDRMAAGAESYRFAPSADPGGVFVYERNAAGLFEESAFLPPPPLVSTGPFAQETFGNAVALDGDLLAVGNRFTDTGGRVHIYRFDGVDWVPEQTIDCPIQVPGNSPFSFGRSVEIDEETETLAVAHWATSPPVPRSRVWTFQRDPATGRWRETDVLHPVEILTGSSTQSLGSTLGARMRIEEDTLVASAPGEPVNGRRGGAVHVYRRQGLQWELVERLAEPRPTAEMFGFGEGLDLEDGRVVVGSKLYAPSLQNYFETNTGRAYLYELSSGTEVCAGSGGTATLNLLPDDDDPALLTASVYGLSGSGVGLFVVGDPGAQVPFGSGALCVGDPQRISAPIAFGPTTEAIYRDLVHPEPTSPMSFAFQFVYLTGSGPTARGSSSARVLD